MRIVISCMDRRLNQFLEKNFNDGNTIFVRNAGANVNSLRNTLALLKKADEILLLPHTDCGAMGVVEKALKGEKLPAELEPLISPFRKYLGYTKAQLEKVNVEVQESALKGAVKAKVRSELIRTEELNAPASSDNVALVMPPSTRKYSEVISPDMMYRTYVIQTDNDGDIDVLIAKEFLKVRDVKRIS
ncbi:MULTISPECIES: carbonic anhydrase [Metallosphaera]|uniref:Carbonic anhydrase n=4 Tax=Metallosphaera TaxID=41980 RepID=A4YDR5_METS5|nr:MULTISPECIES: carbonic anhydrase [Metallosphaera]ABP94567.1 carbonic anhydrase [Metallosphaera sedula DSM 5348]AIM26554.1 carbonic anhydrase [Metallosphaera sedula]MCY0862209.1 carbonic anhydrase [Metallosphaera prunae]WPX06609.1 carbonic anhydrase [Metallosphaera sedula DSM 5348]BBL46385.1 carbonic anhydrase [Metallosphaera sedula]